MERTGKNQTLKKHIFVMTMNPMKWQKKFKEMFKIWSALYIGKGSSNVVYSLEIWASAHTTWLSLVLQILQWIAILEIIGSQLLHHWLCMCWAETSLMNIVVFSESEGNISLLFSLSMKRKHWRLLVMISTFQTTIWTCPLNEVLVIYPPHSIPASDYLDFSLVIH